MKLHLRLKDGKEYRTTKKPHIYHRGQMLLRNLFKHLGKFTSALGKIFKLYHVLLCGP